MGIVWTGYTQVILLIGIRSRTSTQNDLQKIKFESLVYRTHHSL